MKWIDLTGKRFGRLLVISESSKMTKNGEHYWLCKCDCGNEKEIRKSSLLYNNTKSCGCYHKEQNRKSKNRGKFGEAAKYEVYMLYKRGAEKRNLIFELSLEQFLYLTQQNCHYCGLESQSIHKSVTNNGDFIYNGIDRKDNTKGYTIENCVPCNEKCNRAKSAMPYDEFIEWIKNLANHKVWGNS